MIAKLKKRWLRPRVLGVLIGKVLLMGSSDLAAQANVWQGASPATQHAIVWSVPQSPDGCSISSWENAGVSTCGAGREVSRLEN